MVVPMVWSASKDKPHGHNGILESYDGKPLPLHITAEQDIKLNNGEAVMLNERSGKSGRGFVIQDIGATPTICMDKIRDLKLYPKVVPHLKSVDIYDHMQFPNGTTKTGAKFDVSIMGMGIGYYLLLTHEPAYNTLTWTLDYKRNSDFDDNVGHWQVEPHPKKSGWTRLLYSTKVKLFPWVPEFLVNFLTNKALSDSTAWVKRESELEAQRQFALAKQQAENAVPAVSIIQKPAASSSCICDWFKKLKGGAVLKEKFNVDIEDIQRKMTTTMNRFKLPFSFSKGSCTHRC